MSVSKIRGEVLAVLIQAFISGCLAQSYSELEALGINCPSMDRCEGYDNKLTYIDRSCECDLQCTAYEDCCIDALQSRSSRPQASRPPPRKDVTCLHYSEHPRAGVYAVNKCSSSWNGPEEVREKCVGSDDWSDLLAAVPVTDVAKNETYRNVNCAACNNVNLDNLKTHRMKMKCDGVDVESDEHLIDDLTYNEERQLWGVNRLNRFGNATEFYGCVIIFDVPEYLNNSVRFCRFNFISKCASNWKRPKIAKLCEQYMTVVYANEKEGYRNPHCAICNRKTTNELSCSDAEIGRNQRPSFPVLIDFLGPSNVGKKPGSPPACPSNQVYSPKGKKCIHLICAIAGKSLGDGKCVQNGK